jgi:hypothetical protein
LVSLLPHLGYPSLFHHFFPAFDLYLDHEAG